MLAPPSVGRRQRSAMTDDVCVSRERPRIRTRWSPGIDRDRDGNRQPRRKDRQTSKLGLEELARDLASRKSKDESAVDSEDGVVPARAQQLHRRRRQVGKLILDEKGCQGTVDHDFGSPRFVHAPNSRRYTRRRRKCFGYGSAAFANRRL